MSKSQKKIEKEMAKAKVQKENSSQKVKMKFNEDKFYNDFTKPEYEKNKVYTIEGADKIQRWLKRGGVIVEGELKVEEPAPNPSELVPNKYSEKEPYNPKQEEPKAEIEQEPEQEIKSLEKEDSEEESE